MEVKTWIIKAEDVLRLKSAQMRYMRKKSWLYMVSLQNDEGESDR